MKSGTELDCEKAKEIIEVNVHYFLVSVYCFTESITYFTVLMVFSRAICPEKLETKWLLWQHIE